MTRITEQHLLATINRLNRLTGANPAAWTRRKNGALIANVGTYYLDYGFRGVSLAHILNAQGGIRQPFGPRTWTKRELADLLDAYIAGMEDRP